jgi:hypothetical protein
LRALARSPHVANLAHLDLEGNALDFLAFQALATSPQLAGLVTLRVGRNMIGKGAAKALANSTHLAQLSELDFGWNSLDLATTDALIQGVGLRRLSLLVVYERGLSETANRRLRRRFGTALEGEPDASARKARLAHADDWEWP